MRLLRKSIAEGLLVLRLDALDDLWTLRNLIGEGDLVAADTVRTAESPGDKVREAKMEKRRMRLGVRAIQVEWHSFDDHLRVLGPIETGPQDHGRHHTLALRPGDEVEIQKRHPIAAWQLRLVEEAVAQSQAPQVLLLAIDDAEAQFAHLKAYGLQLLGSLPSAGQGKRHPGAAEAKRAFYDEVLRSLQLFRAEGTPLVVVGPGWWREEFLAHARDKAPAAVAGAITDGTSQGGRGGLQEALRRGVVDQVARDHRVARETALVERVLESIARGDGLCAYGPAEVARAVAAGAVDDLLASDEAVRTGKATALLHAAEAARARIHIVSGLHDAGSRLAQMGGLAALLRFRLDS
ncbi:MAG: protein pelota [Thermoplasmata archaeon]|nr:protein pelota [Thermoplasmata archaeon]